MKIKSVLFGSLVVIAIVSVSLLASCAKGIKCSYSTISFTVADSEVTALTTYVNTLGLNPTKDPRGFYYIIEKAGDEVKPALCDNISFTYQGKLTNGNVFDESSTPVTYALGQLILGWQWSLPLIGQGGKIRLFLPPSLGYGNIDRKDGQGNVVIPKNSILDFEVSLTAVKK
jgi:FKBP-type peptidyl-prolyl cis-trans isomerase FkpA